MVKEAFPHTGPCRALPLASRNACVFLGLGSKAKEKPGMINISLENSQEGTVLGPLTLPLNESNTMVLFSILG